MTVDKEKVEQFIVLRGKGLSFDRIAKELEVSKPTLLKWQSQYRRELKESEFYEYQNLVEQMGIMRRDRFEMYSKLLSSVKGELEKRIENSSLERVPTDKLVELSMKLEERLSKDINKPLVSVHSDYDFELSLGEVLPID